MLPLLIFNVLLYCAHISEANNVIADKNAALTGAHTPVKQLGDQVFDAGLTVLNATYPRVPLLNQSLPELPTQVANSSIGQLAKAAVDAASALEKKVLTYRLPLLNETLPALPDRLANSTVGELAQDLINQASAKEAGIQDVIKPLPPVVATPTFSKLLPLAASLRTTNFTNFPSQSLPSVTFGNLQYTGWVPVVLADGQTYLAAARSATGAPLYYSLMLPPGSVSRSFQLRSVTIVRTEDVLLTGYAADGRPPYTYLAAGACDVTQDCTTGDLTAMYGWGQLSAVTFASGNTSVNPMATSSQIMASGRRRLQQAVGTSGDANATADSAFFIITPLYTASPNPIVPYKAPNSLVVPQTCSPGSYGQYCSLPDDCNSNGATNPTDGTCICFAPYTGQFCNSTIASSTIAQGTSTPAVQSSAPAVQSSTPAIPTSTPTLSTTGAPTTAQPQSSTRVLVSSSVPPITSTAMPTTNPPTTPPPTTPIQCSALPNTACNANTCPNPPNSFSYCGCQQLTTLDIENTAFPTNMSYYTCLQSITGDATTSSLTLNNVANLTSLAGLQSLTTVQARVVLTNLNALTTLDSSTLPALKTVGADIFIDSDPALTVISGFQALTSISTLSITNNAALTNITAFPSLTTYTGIRPNIDNNPLLIDVSGLLTLAQAYNCTTNTNQPLDVNIVVSLRPANGFCTLNSWARVCAYITGGAVAVSCA
ncbi:hypothetical protein COCOBI_13-0310 [Coccomyxa sp. Obi]|nr:hypothetical protein COCOBI_13-0310 [Coccomyxa sp. Obi]